MKRVVGEEGEGRGIALLYLGSDIDIRRQDQSRLKYAQPKPPLRWQGEVVAGVFGLCQALAQLAWTFPQLPVNC